MLKQSRTNHFSPGNSTLENKYLLTNYSYTFKIQEYWKQRNYPTFRGQLSKNYAKKISSYKVKLKYML